MDLRLGCLGRARAQLRATVDSLTDASDEVLDHAHELVGALPNLDRCDDVAVLRSEARPPADELARVEDARARLDRIALMRTAGQMADARRNIDELQVDLGNLSFEPLKIEVLLEDARIADGQGELEKAGVLTQQGLDLALRIRNWRLVATAAIRMTAFKAVRLDQPREAQFFAQIARPFAAVGREQAELHTAMGWALGIEEDFAQALVEMTTASEMLTHAFGPASVELATAQINTGEILRRGGQYEDAKQEVAAGLEILVLALGPQHPGVARARSTLALILEQQAKWAEAELEIRRALEIYERLRGSGHPQVTSARNILAVILEGSGRYSEALNEHERNLESWGNQPGLSPLWVAQTHANLGKLLFELGRHSDARAHLLQAIELNENSFAPQKRLYAFAYSMLAEIHLARDENAEAQSVSETSVAMARESFPPIHPQRVLAEARHGQLLSSIGRHREAAEYLEVALAALTPDSDPGRRADVEFLLAKSLWKARIDRSRARRLAASAVEGFARAGEAFESDLEAALRWRRTH